jgi:hypothetical protein
VHLSHHAREGAPRLLHDQIAQPVYKMLQSLERLCIRFLFRNISSLISDYESLELFVQFLMN